MINNSILFLIIGAGLTVSAFFLINKFLNKKRAEKISAFELEAENKLNQLIQTALKNASEQFLTLAGEKFGDQKEKIKLEIEGERKAIGEIILNLNEQLKNYETLIKSFESDRDKKYGSLAEQMKSAAQVTEKLQGTTNKLVNILGNVKIRGQWGEKMAEDILKYIGMVEEINYKKNKSQDTLATRPDFVFFLPDNHKIYMDVKFPFNAYLNYINENNEEIKEKHKKQFIDDVKSRIKEITHRDYINPEEKTLDYILMFIANDQVYAFINETSPEIIDEALSRKVILCSPWTLYAVLKILRQAWDNYHIQTKVKEIIQFINAFAQEYEKFKEKIEDHGKHIEKLHKSFHQLQTTRVAQLDRKIEKIEKIRQGQMEENPELESQNPKQIT